MSESTQAASRSNALVERLLTSDVAPLETLPRCDSGADRPGGDNGSGTFRSSVFMVFNSAVGSGLLTLPYAFLAGGLFGGALTLLFFVVVEFGTVLAVLQCTAASYQRAYPGVVRHYLGPRAGNVFSAVIALYCFFACAGGLIIVKNVMPPLLRPLTHGAASAWASPYVQVGVAAVAVFPLLCLRHISSLRFTAMLSFGAACFVVVVVAYEYFAGVRDAAADGPLDYWGEWPSACLAVPNVMLALQAHLQVPAIYADMAPHARSLKAMAAAAGVAYVLILLLYATIAAFGLLTFRRATRPNIMESDYDAARPEVVAARLCLTLTALCSVPVNHHPAREAVWAMASRGSFEPVPPRFLYAETTAFFAAAVALALGIDELSTLNDLMGLSAGVAVIFVLPAACLWCSAAAGAQPRLKALSLIYLVVGLLSFALCAYSFVGSEWLGVAVRPAPGWHPPSAPPPAFDALGTREAWPLWLDPWE
eukprot:Transcript_20670.p1 GENE.Transcript_20670~~Transcript_20670.p1  ORF type:complete len:521 (-),score=134.30 Transcript_20670:167-1603(-)